MRAEKINRILELLTSGDNSKRPQLFIMNHEDLCVVYYPEDILPSKHIPIDEAEKILSIYPDVRVLRFLNNPPVKEDCDRQGCYPLYYLLNIAEDKNVRIEKKSETETVFEYINS